MLRAVRASMRWSVPFLFLATIVAAHTRAAYGGGPGADEFSRAMRLHQSERWDEAAQRFIAAYQAGHRPAVSAYSRRSTSRR